MTDSIRLLHLSDLHFRSEKRWDSDPVLRDLARFVQSEVAKGLIPDFVVITGDLANSGQSDEYRLAREWLETELWPAVVKGSGETFPQDRLLLVPGNHDVDWDRVTRGVGSIQDGLLNEQSQDSIAESLQDDDERAMLLKRHSAYLHTLTHISVGRESSYAGHAEPYLLKSAPVTTDGARADGRGNTEQAMRAAVRWNGASEDSQ